MTLDYIFWLDKETGDHETLFQDGQSRGYQTVSMCLAGDPGDPRFTTVMINDSTVVQEQFFLLTPANWTTMLNQMAAQGWGPHIVAATGPRTNPVMGVIFRPMNPLPLVKYGLSESDLAAQNDLAWRNGTILGSIDAYGSASDARFIALWRANTERVAWNMEVACNPVNAADFMARLRAIAAQGGRLALLAITPNRGYVGLFVDSRPRQWKAAVSLNSNALQGQITGLDRRGLAPLCIAANGSDRNAIFGAVFADSAVPMARTFRSSGPISVTEIDQAMQAFVQDHALRGAALAITKETQLVYVRGYTYAEPTYPDVQPTTLFRLASVSKTLCAIAIYQLIQENKLTLDQTMQSVLNLTTPSGQKPVDSRFCCVTIRELLDSTSSINRGGFWSSVAAAAAFGQPLPATPDQLMSFIASLNLESDPGNWDDVRYNNTAYFLLGQIVAKLRGAKDFPSAIGAKFLSPLGITRIRGSRSLVTAQASDEARYHLSNIRKTSDADWVPSLAYGASLRTPDRPLVAAQYGTADYEMFAGGGGISAAAVDLARVVAALSWRSDQNPMLLQATLDALLGNAVRATAVLTGPDAHGYYGFDGAWTVDANQHIYTASKGGWLPSNQSTILFTTGGLGYVWLINGNTQDDVTTDWFWPVTGAAQARNWGTADLFPNFGMPSLLRVKVTKPPPILQELQGPKPGLPQPPDIKEIGEMVRGSMRVISRRK